MNEDNRKKVYDVLKSQTGYRDSYEDFNKAFDANEDNRKRVYDVLKSQTGYLDSYEDFSRGMGYPSSNQPGSVSQQVVNEYEQAAKQSSLRELVNPVIGKISEEDWAAKTNELAALPYATDINSFVRRIKKSERDAVREEQRKQEGWEDQRIDSSYKPKSVASPQDIFNNYADRFALTERGNELRNEYDQLSKETADKYLAEFEQTPEYKEIAGKKYGSKDEQYEANKRLNELFAQKYGKLIEEEMRPYGEALNKQMMIRYGNRINDELQELNKKNTARQLDELSAEVDKELERLPKATLPETASAGDVMQQAVNPFNNMLNNRRDLDESVPLYVARNMLDEARRVVEESKKEDGIGRFGRSLRDNTDTFSLMTLGMFNGDNEKLLNNALRKYEKGEKLTSGEEKLLEASAVNLAVQAYYGSELGRWYNAGQTTAASVPFMLELAINPIAHSGNAIAKSLLKFGLRRFGRAGSFAAHVGGATGAALGMTGTTGAPRVASNAMERLNQNYEYYLDEDDNLHVQKTGDVGAGEAWGKSIASTALENQSEMILNAFSVFRPYLRQINDALPGGVNAFMQRIKNSRPGQLYREIKNNPTMREMMRRTQIQGFPQEYLEEVYNNFASIPLGDMTFEEAVDLDNNLDIIFGLTPTFLAFGMLGAGGMAVERYQNRKRMERIFGKMTSEQRKKFEELQRMSKANGNEDIKNFIKITMADPELTQEQKREEIEYAFALAKQNDMDEIQEAETQDKIDAEAADIAGHSDPGTNMYTEAERIYMNDVGEWVKEPGHIVGWQDPEKERFPYFVPEGMEFTPENTMLLRPGEWDVTTVRSMPTQEVIDETAQAIREDAAEQAQRESTYSPDIVPYANLKQEDKFTDKDGNTYEVIGKDTDTQNWTVNKTSPEDKILYSGPISEQEYLDLMQAQLDAQEQQTASQQATDGVSTGNGRRLDETEPQQPLTPQQQEVESLRQAGVDEEVIRNTIDDRVKKAKSALDKAERQAKAPIKDAKTVKEEMSARKKALDEARAVYEGWNALLSPEPAPQVQQTQEDAGARSVPQGRSMTSEEAKDSTIESPNSTQENQIRENLWKVVSYLNSKYNYDFAEEVSFVEWITSKKDNIQWLKDRLGPLYKEAIQNINDFVSIQNQKNKSQVQSRSEIEPTRQIDKPLTADEANALLTNMENRADVAPELELTIENWDAQFGADGLVQTPIGEVKMGENQFAKMMRQGRNGKLGMVKPTLENPDVIIEDKGGNVDENVVERVSSYLFIKAFVKPDGGRYYYFTSVTVSKDGREVVVSNPEKSQKRISKLLQQNPVAWINDKFSLHPTAQIKGSVPLSETNKPTQTDNRPALLGVNSPEPSEDKNTNLPAENQASTGETVPMDEKGKPLYHRAPVDATLANINSKGLTPDEVDTFVQANKDAAAKLLKKEEDKAPKMVTDLDKYVADKAAWQEKVADAQAQVDYWNQVGETIAAQRAQRQAGGTEAASRPADDGVRAAEGAVAEGASGGEGIENRQNAGNNEINVVSSQRNQTENDNGTVSEPVPQGEHRTEAPQDSRMEEAAAELRTRVEAAARDAQASGRTLSGGQEQELEQRAAESYAKETGQWIPMADTFAWQPMPSGNENNVYLNTDDGHVYKVNNLMNSKGILPLFERISLYNQLFPESKYEFVGFTGFDGGSVYPVFRQEYVNDAIFATPEEIDAYMQSLGFQQTGEAEYSNGNVTISDLRPRNVLKDTDGDLYVIDADFRKNKQTGYVTPERQADENLLDYAERVAKAKEIADARKEVSANPTDAQKEAGNYKKGHITLDGYDITIENPKGSTRSGVDANGQLWSVTMNNDYGYIRGTEGVDGDHIDVFLSDEPTTGKVYVIDQVKEDGTFDEHKVMYGFKSALAAKRAYLANYSPDWKGLGTITEVSKDEFKKWVDSSHRKTKPFAEYRSVKVEGAQSESIEAQQPHTLPGRLMKAYESGDKALIASVEQEMRDFVNAAKDMRSVYATYLRSRDLERSMEKGSPSNKTQHLIAEACKDALKKAGLPAKAMQSERARTEAAGSTTDTRVLDIMSADSSFDVLNAIVKNPHTSNETLERFVKTYSNNGFDYDAQQELDKRKAAKDGQTTSEHLPGSGKMNREQEETEKVKQQSGPVEKIEDVGEKIGGAKKDRFKEFVEKEKQIQEKPDSFMEELRKLPVSKIFNFNLEALRKDGLSNEAATLIDVIRRVIPAKPRTDWKLKRWVSDVFGLYRFCLTLATAEQGTFDNVLERVTNIKQIGGMYRAQMALGGFDSGLDTGQATLEELGDSAGHYDKDGKWVSIKGQWYVTHAGRYGGIYPGYEKAKEALAQFAGENSKGKEKGTEVKFSVYSYKNSGEAFITPKGKPNIVVESGFKSSKEAMDYLNEHMDELQAKYRNMKDSTSIGFAPNSERRGKDWRGGKDVTAEDFRNTFGFRGVEFGNWANQQERQRALNQAYDAFMDLSEATGISPQGLSLGGELGMAFGARGGGGAAAHYEPGKVVINLTKTQGAGTLAHEWWHAIDNYFSRRRGQALGYNTERKGYNLPVRGGKVEREHEAERKEITDAFADLMKAINGSSYGERSNAYASLKSSYWKEPTELGARAFAVWVERKLSEKGIVNNFLANNNTIGWESPELTQKYYPYPLESDFESLDVAFDNLFGAIEEKVDEETGNTVLYRNGAGFLSDDVLSATNDPVSKFLGKSTRTVRQRKEFSERERRNMAARVQELAGKLHLDNVEIVDEPMAITDRKGKTHYPKGFYNRATDKIVIVIPNNSSTFDAEQTLLHEAVAHYGLRRLFGEHFDTFLDNVFNNADVEVRRKIAALAQKNGWDTRLATEEYLASLAEDTNFDDLSAGWWRKIKELFLRMLHKIGFEGFDGVTLSDNELRYILWRSYENLREPGRFSSILGQAEDIAKQYELKVGNYSSPLNSPRGGAMVAEAAHSAKAERIRKLRESKPVEITGKEIEPSDDLKQYKKNALEYGKKLQGSYTNKDTGTTIQLQRGRRNGGINEVLQHDYKDVEHLQSIAAIPQIIENSIYIDSRGNTDTDKNPDVKEYQYYVCGLKIGGVDYTVRSTVAVDKNGNRYYDHKLTHIEKGKLLDLINSQAAYDNGFGTTPGTKPTTEMFSDYKDKVLLSILQDNSEENLLFREADNKKDADSMNTESPSPISTPTVEAWDKLANSFKFQLRETAVDHLTAVEKFQDLVAKHSGKEIQAFENAYNLMLALSSKTKNEMDMFDSFLVRPLNKAILELVGGKSGIRKWNWDNGPLRELVMYVEAKHGAERNRQMAVEKLAKGDASEESILKDWSEAKKRINARKNLFWMEKQRLLDEEAAKLGADLSKDYSGLSSVFKDTEKYPKGWKESSWEYVEQYEKEHDAKDIDALWNAISNATGYALQKQYESGLVSKEYVERQKDRFENYVPLRGFADEIAGDVYNYMGNDFYPGGNPVKKAGGRTSEAGNPFGSILNTAYASMSTGNKNMAKLALYSLVVNHDTGGLAITNRAWMVKYDELKGNKELGELLVIPKIPAGEETPEWVEAVPKMPEKATSEEITEVLKRFEEAMNKYQKADVTKPVGKKAKTAYRTLYHERDQHDIPLYIAGDKYVITVTGNPRLAQAMNGLLNPDVNNDALTEVGKRVQRFMAGAFTAKNAFFALANLFKDSMYANNQAFIRENPKYWMKFTKNQRLGFGDFLPMMWRLYKYRKGKTMNGKTDRLFKEFMDNGGATGYTFVNNQDEYARELAKKLKDLSRKTPKWFTPKGLLKLFFDLVEFAGQSAELVNRFAAYKTSREMGRSINRSIIDAKEITVNFNRKGAGRKSADPNKSWYSPINVASAVSQYGRASILFWNANMQAKYRLYKNLKEHPVMTSITLMANSMAIGAVAIPLLNNLLLPALYDVLGWSSGDDDEDYYDVLTDWERTHNICIRLPEGYWLKIPLSPEMSPWYSMGDAIFGAASGKRDISATDFVKFTIDAVSPLSMNWSYEGSQFLLNFLPTIGQPPFQNMMNVNFMGNPLHKTPFNAKQGFTPEYKMVYNSTSPTLIELSRLSNLATGGSDLKKGWADWNPATLQNLISGYTGGYGTTILSVADWIVGTSQGEKQSVTFSRMPLVSRFVISGNKDVKLKRINSSFYKVRDFVNEFEYDRKSYQDAIREAQKEGNMLDVADYTSQLEDLLDSDRAKKYVQLKDLVDASKRYEDYLKEFPEDETTRNLLYGIKMEGIERLRE